MAQLTSPRLATALAAALLPLPLMIASMAARADDAALRQLVEQGRFWEQRDQPERTRAAWQRVLTVDPNNAEALSHLAILSAAGFVTVRSDGAKRFYSLRPQPFRELAGWLGRYTHVWERRKYIRVTRRKLPR